MDRQISIVLILCFFETLSSQHFASNSFKILLNQDDPFRNSHDFVTVQSGDLIGYTGRNIMSSVVSLELAFHVCGNATDILTNLLIFAETESELKSVLRKLTQQSIELRRKTNPGTRFYCRVFILTKTCKKPGIRQSWFLKNVTNTGGYRNLIPFNWESDLYLMEYCNEKDTSLKKMVKIREVFTVKNNILTNLLTTQTEIQTDGGQEVSLNMTSFSLAHLDKPKVLRRHNLQGIQLAAAVFVNKDDEVGWKTV